MNTFKQLINDLSFQRKQGFFILYTGLTLIYILLGALVPESFKAYYYIGVFYSDPVFLGAFFIGALIILEKQQGIYKYLSITPLTDLEYLLAKSVSLSLIAFVVAFSIVLFSGIIFKVHMGYLALSILLPSMFFINLGVIQGVKTQSINGYFIRMIPMMLILFIPFVLRLLFKNHFLFSICPSVAGYELLRKAFYLSSENVIVECFSLLIAIIITLFMALKAITKNQRKGENI